MPVINHRHHANPPDNSLAKRKVEASGCYLPAGEEVPVTLQMVVGGSDGILIGTDTKMITSPFGPMVQASQRHALELGKVRSGEYGVEKVIFNDRKTIGVVCSGSEVVYKIGRKIAENIEAVWNEYSGPIEALCLEKWNQLAPEEKNQALRIGENVIILVHASKPQIFKIRFKLDQLEPFPFSRNKFQKVVVLGGDHLNPSGMLIERYLPKKPPSINKLALLVAHYILVGGELNPGGVEGLRLYFSKNGDPFQAVGEDVIGELHLQSERLNKRTQRAILQAVTF